MKSRKLKFTLLSFAFILLFFSGKVLLAATFSQGISKDSAIFKFKMDSNEAEFYKDTLKSIQAAEYLYYCQFVTKKSPVDKEFGVHYGELIDAFEYLNYDLAKKTNSSVKGFYSGALSNFICNNSRAKQEKKVADEYISKVLSFFFFEKTPDEKERLRVLEEFKAKLFNKKKEEEDFAYFISYADNLINQLQHVNEEALAEEQRLAEEERKKAEEQRLAEEKKKAEEQRLAEEKKKAEAQRLAEEKKKADEEKQRLAEEKKKAEAKIHMENFYKHMDIDQLKPEDLVYLVNTKSKKFVKSLDGSYSFIGEDKSVAACTFVDNTNIDDFFETSLDDFEYFDIKGRLDIVESCRNISDISSLDFIIFNKLKVKKSDLNISLNFISKIKNNSYAIFVTASYEDFLSSIRKTEELEKQKKDENLNQVILTKNPNHYTYISTDLDNKKICINDELEDAQEILNFTLSKDFLKDYYNFPGEGSWSFYTYPLDSIYLKLKTSECGYILSNGKNLYVIYEALERDEVPFEITSGGFSKDVFITYLDKNKSDELSNEEIIEDMESNQENELDKEEKKSKRR